MVNRICSSPKSDIRYMVDDLRFTIYSQLFFSCRFDNFSTRRGPRRDVVTYIAQKPKTAEILRCSANCRNATLTVGCFLWYILISRIAIPLNPLLRKGDFRCVAKGMHQAGIAVSAETDFFQKSRFLFCNELFSAQYNSLSLLARKPRVLRSRGLRYVYHKKRADENSPALHKLV